MERLLDRVDAKLSPDELQGQRDGKPVSPIRMAFSAGLINITMLLAIIYPVLSLLGQWIAGSPMQIGDLSIAPAGSGIARIFITIWLLALGVVYYFLRNSKSRRLLPLFIPAAVILYGGFFLSKQFSVPPEIAFAGAVAGALTITEGKYGPHPVFRIAYLGVLLSAVTLTIILLPDLNTTKTIPPAYLLLFFAIFPIFNALADFASTGLTRLLLRRGLSSPTWTNALLDTIGGIVIFFLLGVFLISYIHFVRPQNGIALLNLGQLFKLLDNSLSDYWWLAVMLGSTLLPTFLHLVVGVSTMLIQYPERLRKWVVDKLTLGGEGSDTDGWQGSLAVCGMITASWWVPIIAFYLLFTLTNGKIIASTIGGFHWWAQFIGAV